MSITFAMVPLPTNPLGFMQMGPHGFLDVKWVVLRERNTELGDSVALSQTVSKPALSQRETLPQPSRLLAANTNSEKWPR